MAAVWPVIAVVAWLVVVWQAVAARRAARFAAMPAPVIERTPPRVPTIAGTVAAPAETKTIDPEYMAGFLTARVIGQDVVARQLARGIYQRMAREHWGNPVFTSLLSGRTGTHSRAKHRIANAARVRLEPLVAIGWINRSPSLECATRRAC